MRVLSLFSGGGLGDYGLELAGMEIVGQVEIDDYCQKILKLRWPDVPKWGDIREVNRAEVVKLIGQPDIISGGFPCQDISNAGNREGITGQRSGLWKEMFRVICEVRPRYVLVENVAALLGRGLGVVLGDLAEIGYDTEWDCIPASALGAPHQRDRIWIVAYANASGERRDERKSEVEADARDSNSNHESQVGEIQDRKNSKSLRVCFDVADSNGGRQPQSKRIFTEIRGRLSDSGKEIRNAASKRLPDWAGGTVGQPSPLTEFERSGGREIERDFRGMAHGVANRVDRFKLLGNGQVVQVVQWIGERIMAFNNELGIEE